MTEETIIGARALTEKWRSIASQAKTTPAIGATNPADIAAAAPQATYTSGFNFVGSTDLTSAPTEEPKWSTGPYWPTDAPPLAEINAAVVDKNPSRTGKGVETRCVLRIVSAGPCQRSMSKARFNPKIKRAAATSAIQRVTSNPIKLALIGSDVIKASISKTPSTKRFAATPPEIPMIAPTRSMRSNSNVIPCAAELMSNTSALQSS